jgi:hypothetical protein
MCDVTRAWVFISNEADLSSGMDLTEYMKEGMNGYLDKRNYVKKGDELQCGTN